MKLILPILIILLSLFFTLVGLKLVYNMFQFCSKGIKTTGLIIKINTSTAKSTEVTYSPVISFNTMDGQTITYDVNAYYFKKYSIGQKLEVIYDEKNPTKVRLNTFKHKYAPSLFVIITGLGGICIGISLLIKNKIFINNGELQSATNIWKR